MAGVVGIGGRDLAVDLGTANTLIHEQGRGIVLDEPSVVAVEVGTDRLLAAGADAKEMLGRHPGQVRVVRPMRHGVIDDVDLAELMLRYFVARLRPSRLLRPRMVVCVPAAVTGVERRALEEAAARSGARRVHVLEESLAAAIGAGLPVEGTQGSMVVDIGAGTTDVAVLSLGGIVNAASIRCGGDDVDAAIVAHVRDEYGLLVGERTAEEIKTEVGSAFPLSEEVSLRVRGRDLATGLPRTVSLSSQEIRRAIDAPVLQVRELIRSTLDACPPEIAGDVLAAGVALTGGGARLPGLVERLRHELGVPVTLSEDPSGAVVRGAGRCVEDFARMRVLLTDARRY